MKTFKNITIAALMSLLVLSTLPLTAAVADMTRVVTEQAPKAGPAYSQAIRAGQYLFISGQIGIDPTTGHLAGTTVEEQTRQVIKNIKSILADQGLTLENVVRSEVYLTDLSNFAAMNTIYGEEFSHDIKPARSTFQISKIPHDAIVKIECTAFIPD